MAKRRAKKLPRSSRGSAPHSPQLRKGMPAADSVREIVDFVSPDGAKFKILKTSEMDAYYRPPRKKKKKKRRRSRPKRKMHG